MAYLDLSRAVRGVDSLLRLHQGIREFTDDEECVLRIALGSATRSFVLSDGITVRDGDPVLQLHFWNEHLPLMPEAGPSAAWANLMKRRVHQSLRTLANYLARESSLDSVIALHGSPPFNSRLGALQMVRTANRFGFDVIEPFGQPEFRERIHEIFDSMLLWGLIWAFNPTGLRSRSLLRHRYQLWMSRRRLSRFYGANSAAARGSERSLIT